MSVLNTQPCFTLLPQTHIHMYRYKLPEETAHRYAPGHACPPVRAAYLPYPLGIHSHISIPQGTCLYRHPCPVHTSRDIHVHLLTRVPLPIPPPCPAHTSQAIEQGREESEEEELEGLDVLVGDKELEGEVENALGNVLGAALG